MQTLREKLAQSSNFLFGAELVSIRGNATSGVHKDVVVVEARTTVEADLIPNNPGNTLFHCHQQDHMDAGFMALFRYA